MLEAAIIGRWRSKPGLFSMRRRIRRLRRFNWRWTLAFTRKPPGGRTVEGGKYLDCSPIPGGFRASRPRSASDYAWLRPRSAPDLVWNCRTTDRGPCPDHACGREFARGVLDP